jgi:hypothetical protein
MGAIAASPGGKSIIIEHSCDLGENDSAISPAKAGLDTATGIGPKWVAGSPLEEEWVSHALRS